MNLDFYNNLNKKNDKSSNNFREDLNNYLLFMDGDFFTVDRFEDHIAVLENRHTGKLINITINNLPKDVKEGDILSVIDGKLCINEEKTNCLSKNIQSRFNKLKKHN